MSTLHATSTTFRTAALLPFTPFIGLAFIVALPVAGIAILAWFAARALARRTRLMTTIRNVALFFAAPFVGLAYVLAMPFVGLVMLAWFVGKTLARRMAATEPVPALRTI